MSEHDLERNGVISFLEFKYVFMDVQDQEVMRLEAARGGKK